MFLSKLAKSLMLPIAVLPIAAILLRLGQGDLLDIPAISLAGDAVFSNLPMIFAIGVAVGFAKDAHGAAALAAYIGHVIFLAVFNKLLPDANMGVLSGILIGLLSSYLFNKYRNIRLPSYISFFGGSRFVPIVTGVSALLLAFVFSYVWGPIGYAIQSLGNFIIGSNQIGIFIYGVANRLLLPMGLHHILNNIFWFQFGDFSYVLDGAQQVAHGDLSRFFAGDKTAGDFMSLFFPVMMFGLPGGALAMYMLSKPKNKKLAFGILSSAAFTAFLTGVTEPLEYSFMFISFPLYIVHAILTGVSGVIMSSIGTKLGFGFSAGLFDYIINWNLATNPARLIYVGLGFFVLYFVVFYAVIKALNLKTIGREDDDSLNSNAENKTESLNVSGNSEYESYLLALGGLSNIISIDNCITRLRLEVKNNDVINEDQLRLLGAKGVVKPTAKTVQVIIGPEVEIIANGLKDIHKKANK